MYTHPSFGGAISLQSALNQLPPCSKYTYVLVSTRLLGADEITQWDRLRLTHAHPDAHLLVQLMADTQKLSLCVTWRFVSYLPSVSYTF